MAGQRGTGRLESRPPVTAQRRQRRHGVFVARMEKACTPSDRVAVAAEYLRGALRTAVVPPEVAERVTVDVVARLTAAVEYLHLEEAAGDERARVRRGGRAGAAGRGAAGGAAEAGRTV